MNVVIEDPPSVCIYAAAFEQGISPEAVSVRSHVDQVLKEFQKSISLSSKSCTGIDALIATYNETQVPDWDAYGAKPVSFETYCRAESFLKLLPSDLPVPNISAHPDGEIVFEWRASDKKILSISIGAGNIITFAGIFGVTERYGVENFIDEVPSEILAIFGKLFSE